MVIHGVLGRAIGRREHGTTPDLPSDRQTRGHRGSSGGTHGVAALAQATDRSDSGGGRACAIVGGSVGRPMWRRIRSMAGSGAGTEGSAPTAALEPRGTCDRRDGQQVRPCVVRLTRLTATAVGGLGATGSRTERQRGRRWSGSGRPFLVERADVSGRFKLVLCATLDQRPTREAPFVPHSERGGTGEAHADVETICGDQRPRWRMNTVCGASLERSA